MVVGLADRAACAGEEHRGATKAVAIRFDPGRDGAPSFPAKVTRINPAGSIAKITTQTTDGQNVLVDLSLEDYQRLSLSEGTHVYIYPKSSRVFLPEYEI